MRGMMLKEPLYHRFVDGYKVQTRRIIKGTELGNNMIVQWSGGKYSIHKIEPETGRVSEEKEIKPYYAHNSPVYIKEPYKYDECMGNEIITYKHSMAKSQRDVYKWKNKMFMPASVARTFAKVTVLRVERLQHIDMFDAIAEGLEVRATNLWNAPLEFFDFKKWHLCREGNVESARQAFKDLINRINGKGTWESNPYVWVYGIEKITKLEAYKLEAEIKEKKRESKIIQSEIPF